MADKRKTDQTDDHNHYSAQHHLGERNHLGEKVRFSIIVKLNTHLFFKALWAFFLLDLLLCAAACAGGAAYAEQRIAVCAAQIAHTGFPDARARVWLNTQGVAVTRLDKPFVGYVVPSYLQSALPKATSGAKRSVFFPSGSNLPFWQQLDKTTYSVGLSFKGHPYKISLSLAALMRVFRLFFSGLFIIEIIYLFNGLFSNARLIRRTLLPISELAEAAEQLNEAAFSLENMESLAGELNHINAAKLDTRIPVDNVQRELKTIAVSINSLLDRINDAYSSQIRFVSDASHELRTPIAVIQGYANLLDRWGKNDEKTMQESITAIKEETANMKQLVEQLLFLARGDNNSIRLAPESFDLAALVHEVVTETQMIDGGHEYSEKTLPALVVADKALVKQCARILMDNAIKYTPTGGQISAAVYTDGQFACFSVQDSGIGIPPEAVPKIFDRFYRAEQSRARSTGGSGLGLSIAKWIIERHSGQLEVLSREGIGTRITVLLPLGKEWPGMQDLVV
jgi:two-component system, OmpR family, sensor histidine kinase ArlS